MIKGTFRNVAKTLAGIGNKICQVIGLAFAASAINSIATKLIHML